MAIQVLPILKALAPLVVNAAGLMASSRSDTNGRIDDRLRKLESDTQRAGEVLTGVTQQMQALAEELRVQAEVNAALERKARSTLIVAVAGLVAGLAALAVAMFR